MLGVDALVFFDDDLAGAIGDIEVSHFAFPALGYELEHAAFVVDLEVIEIGEESKDGLGRHADGFQQNGYRHLATAVDPEEQNVFGIELKVEPGATVRNHAGRKQQLARAVRDRKSTRLNSSQQCAYRMPSSA